MCVYATLHLIILIKLLELPFSHCFEYTMTVHMRSRQVHINMLWEQYAHLFAFKLYFENLS